MPDSLFKGSDYKICSSLAAGNILLSRLSEKQQAGGAGLGHRVQSYATAGNSAV